MSFFNFNSLSAPKNIQTLTRERKANISIWKTIEQINKLRAHNKKLQLVWILAHSKIQGNETEDSLAKLSVNSENSNLEKIIGVMVPERRSCIGFGNIYNISKIFRGRTIGVVREFS